MLEMTLVLFRLNVWKVLARKSSFSWTITMFTDDDGLMAELILGGLMVRPLFRTSFSLSSFYYILKKYVRCKLKFGHRRSLKGQEINGLKRKKRKS